MNITPTVGRVVWYWPGSGDPATILDNGQPFAATVACVIGNGDLVNLSVVDHLGRQFWKDAIPLLQPDEPDNNDPHARIGCCTWMPYQVGQAAGVQMTVPADEGSGD